MFSWIGRFFIVLFIIFFFTSTTYSDDKLITLAEYLYGEYAYPVVYRSSLPASYVASAFARGIFRFAIPLAAGGFLLYDLYQQYKKWTEYLRTDIKTIDVIKKFNCNGIWHSANWSCYVNNYERNWGTSLTVAVITYNVSTCTSTLSIASGQPVYGPFSKGYYCNLYVDGRLVMNVGDAVETPRISIIPTGSSNVNPRVEDQVNMTTTRPIEDIISDIDQQAPFSNVQPQKVDTIDPNTTDIIPSDYVNNEPSDGSNTSNNSTSNDNTSTHTESNSTESNSTSNDSLNYPGVDEAILNRFLDFFKNLRLPIPSISGSGQCNFIIPVLFGKQGVLDFCQYHNLFQVVGNILVALSGFTSIYILYKNS